MTRNHSISPFIQVCGTERNTSGRQCEQHQTCGLQLQVGMLLRLKKTMADIEGTMQLVVGAYIFSQGHPTCLVGFLPRSKVKWADKYDGKFAQVDEFLCFSESRYEREKSHGKGGIVNCTLLDSVPDFE